MVAVDYCATPNCKTAIGTEDLCGILLPLDDACTSKTLHLALHHIIGTYVTL